MKDTWQPHHNPAIENHGPVYDLSTITVLTPQQHRSGSLRSTITLTKAEMISGVRNVHNFTLSENDDVEMVKRISAELPHGKVTAFMFWENQNFSPEQIIDKAIEMEVSYMAYVATGAPMPEALYRERGWPLGGLTRGEMIEIVATLRLNEGGLRELTDLLGRLVYELSHSSIGDLIYRDKIGLTPEQVIDEAIHRHADYVTKLGKESDQLANHFVPFSEP